MTEQRKRVIQVSFVIWLACWLYILLVLPFAKDIPAAVNVIWGLLLIVSSWVFFLTAAKAKGYSYIIGIGLMMLSIFGAAVLAFLPDKSMTAAAGTKGPVRKLITAYIGIWVFFWFCAIYNGEITGESTLNSFKEILHIIIVSATVGLIFAAIAWVIHWPTLLAGNPFPPMREGYRRICLLALIVVSLAWWLWIADFTNWFTSIPPTGVFFFFAGPIALLLAITVLTRVFNWVKVGFKADGKG